MTYRDANDARQAERDELLRELDEARRHQTQLESKLTRAEGALRAYRRGTRHPDLAANLTPQVVFALCAMVYASAVIAAMQDHDNLAFYLAAASAVFSGFAPLAAWASSQRLLSGIFACLAKLGFSLLTLLRVTSREPLEREPFLLFWWGPAVLLFFATLELGGLWAVTRRSVPDQN